MKRLPKISESEWLVMQVLWSRGPLTANDVVEELAPKSKDYGRTIISLLERFSRPQRLPAMAGILETKSQLKRRIKMIANFKKTSRTRSAGAMLLVGVLACIVLTNAYVAKADFDFGIPTNLGPTINSSVYDSDAYVSDDGLLLYFGSNRPGGTGDWDMWVTTRETAQDPWGEPVNLGPQVNSSDNESGASIPADGLSLFFDSDRSGYGRRDLWVTTRVTKDEPWGTPVNLGPTVNTSDQDGAPSISTDGLSLYFFSDRSGGLGDHDLWVTTRDTKDDEWQTPMNLGPTVNSSYRESGQDISPDGLALFFRSNRPGGLVSGSNFWVTTRQTKNDPWGNPICLGPRVNSSLGEWAPQISADGLNLYFTSDRPGGIGSMDLWQVSIRPVVDFNADGIVDAADMCIMVDHWCTDEPLCDVGPMPWGDGIVDVQDLILLAEHLFTYPGAVAYWKLDETEGDIAYDSVGVYDGVVNGVPTWQPTGGQIDGALQFDGIDDYVSTPLMLDLKDAVFSVFAWVKGGMPGQVVFSQAAASDWLGADTTNGSLMTELKFLFKPSRALQSQTVITDGNWHRIGLVWDGSNRILYVDDVQVASDTYDKGWLIGGLQIGAGKNLDPGTFWFGLIDDVRIYDRAVSP